MIASDARPALFSFNYKPIREGSIKRRESPLSSFAHNSGASRVSPKDEPLERTAIVMLGAE